MNVSILIPAFNEETRIARTVRAACEGVDRCADGVGYGLDREVWVIDDGSSDATADVAEQVGANVIRFPKNRGKGAALTAGVQASAGDVIALLDADLREHAEQVSRLLAPVLAGDCDMTIARFPVAAGGGDGFGWTKGLAAWGIRRLAGLELTSPLSGQRVLTREVADRIGRRFAGGWGVEVALTIDAACCGFRVSEIPVEMEHRVSGGRLSGARHRALQLKDVGWALAPRLVRLGRRTGRA